jgi:hypothetical protein
MDGVKQAFEFSDASAKMPKTFPRKISYANFNCPQCASPVQIEAQGRSLSVVCLSCGSVLDAMGSHAILAKVQLQKSHVPCFEIGSVLTLEKKKWKCIGFGVRSLADNSFTWEEYLLHNPFYGFQWLLFNGGYFYLGKRVNTLPVGLGHQPLSEHRSILNLKNQAFRFYEYCQAKYIYLCGEFYWQAQTDVLVEMADFVHAQHQNLLLSVEKEQDEWNFTVFRWLPRSEVAAFLNPKRTLELPGGYPFLKIGKDSSTGHLTNAPVTRKMLLICCALAMFCLFLFPGVDSMVNVSCFAVGWFVYYQINVSNATQSETNLLQAIAFLKTIR